MAFAPDAAWYEAQYGVIGEVGAASVCDFNDNSPGQFPVNVICFNSGTCELHIPSFQDPAVYGGGTCECADPSKSGNFAAILDGNGDLAWQFGAYSGEFCASFTYQMYSTISYIVYHSENAARSGYAGIENMFECAVGSGSGINWGETGWDTTPDMTTMARLMINYPGQTDLADSPKNYRDYPGKVVATGKDNASQQQHCKICSTSDPCTHPGQASFTAPATGGYLMVTFATNFNTYYNHSCEKPDGSIPLTSAAFIANPDCQKQVLDKGYAALQSWNQAILGDDSGSHHRAHYLELTTQPTATPVRYPTVTDPAADAYGFGWDARLSIPALYVGYGSAGGISIGALDVPTGMPTPVAEPDCFGLGYTHQVSDLTFLGVAEAGNRGCRHGLKTEWPGGLSDGMCGSPYVICLPAENTPNVGFPIPGGFDAYLAADAVYTLDQCKKECAYDQRCVGFEFNPTTGQTGNCVLLDDIPMEHTGTGVSAHSASTESDLLGVADWTTLGGSICYYKNPDNYCNPYFGEEDLNDVMLNCYCPNNRKGFYTKKVVRTVAASRFCGTDTDGAITKRIREAQANRMFHLCENWCLFNVQNPRAESWYHDPWNTCWREQYAGIGTHRSYCYRVIRDPFTIEQTYIDSRSGNMCAASTADHGGNLNTPSPTNLQQPPPIEVTYVLAAEEDSCDDACNALGGGNYCTSTTDSFTSEAVFGALGNPFTAVGVTCSSYEVGALGWALPGVSSNGDCILRNPATDSTPQTEPTGCNVAIGVGYQRICSCSSFDGSKVIPGRR